jgi:hypothetical protein
MGWQDHITCCASGCQHTGRLVQGAVWLLVTWGAISAPYSTVRTNIACQHEQSEVVFDRLASAMLLCRGNLKK